MAQRAMDTAEGILKKRSRPRRPETPAVFSLAEARFQSIHMQLSVDRYQAIDVGRTKSRYDRCRSTTGSIEGRFQAIRS